MINLDLNLLFFLNSFSGVLPAYDFLIVFLAEYLPYFLILSFLLLLYFSNYPITKKINVFLVVSLSAVLARLGAVEIIRSFLHRPRPFLVHPTLNNLFYENDWSFPSGHSAFFFAMAMAIYFYNKKWGLWFFVVAIFMNISRVIAGVHYISDIIAGAILGILSASLVYYIFKKTLGRVRGHLSQD